MLQPGGELVTDRYGLVTGRLTFKARPNRWDLYPAIHSRHPNASFCLMEKRRVVQSRGWWTITGHYAGVEYDSSEKVYELERNTRSEPIETHPDFVEKIGGKPSAPLNGAIYVDETGWPTSDDKLGVFEGFRITLDGSRNKLAGVDSYLAPTNTVWTAQWTSRSKPSPGGGVGKIDNNPEGGAPDYGGEFTWLYTGLTYEDRAGTYSARQTWLLGRWISEIYE